MNRVKERRLALGLSLRELSKRTGVGFTTISTIERERSGCTIFTGTLLAKALDTTLDGLFWEEEEGGKPCQK